MNALVTQRGQREIEIRAAFFDAVDRDDTVGDAFIDFVPDSQICTWRKHSQIRKTTHRAFPAHLWNGRLWLTVGPSTFLLVNWFCA